MLNNLIKVPLFLHVCNGCGRFSEKGKNNTCARCGGVYEAAVLCPDCGRIVPQSETVGENRERYCIRCRKYCPLCNQLVSTRRIIYGSMPSGGKGICLDCNEKLKN